MRTGTTRPSRSYSRSALIDSLHRAENRPIGSSCSCTIPILLRGLGARCGQPGRCPRGRVKPAGSLPGVEISTQVIPVGGGRSIWVDSADYDEGFPILVQAGSPGSRRLFAPAVEQAATVHGLRLISYDRPGFGDTPARPGRTIADAAAETRAIAAGLGL